MAHREGGLGSGQERELREDARAEVAGLGLTGGPQNQEARRSAPHCRRFSERDLGSPEHHLAAASSSDSASAIGDQLAIGARRPPDGGQGGAALFPEHRNVSAEPEEYRDRGGYSYWHRDDLYQERHFAEEPMEPGRTEGNCSVNTPPASPRNRPRRLSPVRNLPGISSYVSLYPSSYDDSVGSPGTIRAENPSTASEKNLHAGKASRKNDVENCYGENAFSEQDSDCTWRGERAIPGAQEIQDMQHFSVSNEDRGKSIWRRETKGYFTETSLFSENEPTSCEIQRHHRDKIFSQYFEQSPRDEECDEAEQTVNPRTRISSRELGTANVMETKFNCFPFQSKHEDPLTRNSAMNSNGKTLNRNDRVESTESLGIRAFVAERFDTHETTFPLENAREPREQRKDFKRCTYSQGDLSPEGSWNDNHSLLGDASAPLSQCSASDSKLDREAENENGRKGQGQGTEVIATDASRAKGCRSFWSSWQRGEEGVARAVPDTEKGDTGMNVHGARRQEKAECNSNATPFHHSFFRTCSDSSSYVLQGLETGGEKPSQHALVQTDESDIGLISETDESDIGSISAKEAVTDSHLPSDTASSNCTDELSTSCSRSEENWSKSNDRETREQPEFPNETLQEITSVNKAHKRDVEIKAEMEKAELQNGMDRPVNQTPEEDAAQHQAKKAAGSAPSLADETNKADPESTVERSASPFGSIPKTSIPPSRCCPELVVRELEGVEVGVGSVSNLQRWQRCMDSLFDVRRHSLGQTDSPRQSQQGTHAEDDKGSAPSGAARAEATQISSRSPAAECNASPVEVNNEEERDNSCPSHDDPDLLYDWKRSLERCESDSQIERDSEFTAITSGSDMADGSDDFEENSKENVSLARLLSEIKARAGRLTSSASYSTPYTAWTSRDRGMGSSYGGSSWQHEYMYECSSLEQSSSFSLTRSNTASSTLNDDPRQLRWSESPLVTDDEGSDTSDESAQDKLWLRLPLSQMAGEADAGTDGGRERPAFLPRTTSRLSKLIYALHSNVQFQRYCSRAPSSPRGRKRKSEEDLRLRESPPALRSILKCRAADPRTQGRVTFGKATPRVSRKRLRFSEEADICVYSCDMNLEGFCPDDQSGGLDRGEQEDDEDSEMNRCESSLSSLSLLVEEAAVSQESEIVFMEHLHAEDRPSCRRAYSYTEEDTPRRVYGDDTAFVRHASSIMNNLKSLAGTTRSLECSDQEPGTREKVYGDAAAKPGSTNLNNSSHYDHCHLARTTSLCSRRVTSLRPSGVGGLIANTASDMRMKMQSRNLGCNVAHKLALRSVKRQNRSSVKRSSHRGVEPGVKDTGRRRQAACRQRGGRAKAARRRGARVRKDPPSVALSSSTRQAPRRHNFLPEIDHLIFVEADTAAAETYSNQRQRRMEHLRKTFKLGGRAVNSIRWQNTSNNGNSDSTEKKLAGTRRRGGARREEPEANSGQGLRDIPRAPESTPDDLPTSFMGLSLREDDVAARHGADRRMLGDAVAVLTNATLERTSAPLLEARGTSHGRDEGGSTIAPNTTRGRIAQGGRTASRDGAARQEARDESEQQQEVAEDHARLEWQPFPNEVTMQMVPPAVGDACADDIFIMDIESNLSLEFGRADEEGEQRELEAGDQAPRTGDMVAPLEQDLDPSLVALNTNNSHLSISDTDNSHLPFLNTDISHLPFLRADSFYLALCNTDVSCLGPSLTRDDGRVFLLLLCVSGVLLVQLICANFILNIVRHLWEWEGLEIYSASDEEIDDIIDALDGSHPSDSSLISWIEATIIYIVVFVFFF